MSLSTWEQQALDSIKGELADSDPWLVTLLTTFSRLASDEAMPVRDKLRAGTRRINPHSHRKQRRCCQTGACRNSIRRHRRFGLQHALILAWLAITAGLITMTFVLSQGGGHSDGHSGGDSGGQGGGHGIAAQTCAGTWPVVCSHVPPG